MLDVAEAEALILKHPPALRLEERALSEASGCVLQQPIVAERDQPPFDRVTMDGIALRFSDWEAGQRNFQVIGTQGAGSPAMELAGAGECIEIMTGAMLPTGADTIVPVERVTREDTQALVESDYPARRGQFIHGQGSDRHKGATLLTPGAPIGPAAMAVLASSGYARVTVASSPRLAVISTGDELVDVDQPVAPFQIRSSNDRAIESALKNRLFDRVTRAHLPDDAEKLQQALAQLHDDHDALILSGGVSMGKFDYVPTVLETLGVELIFHKIRQRPGLPMWFGISAAGKPVYALPGNPVSTLVCLTRYVLPALEKGVGLITEAPHYFPLAEDVTFTADLAYLLPVALAFDPQQSGRAWPRPTNTSGDFSALTLSDGILELPRGQDHYPAGFMARFFHW
jgi:molybdopterin molybdotransferase